MSKNSFKSLNSAGDNRILNVRSDPPDIRDRFYEPALIPLQGSIDNREQALILDQGQEGACTGFGLAAVINLLYRKKSLDGVPVSPRMLYEMAKKHDEWPGEDYAGSSCRGAIRGWKNMGVCSESDWSYKPGNPGELTIDRAKAAREHTIGAYYRVSPEISDYHAALNEVGAIFVSARVHQGWMNPRTKIADKTLVAISPHSKTKGGHAFAIVGYNGDGFIVQNSWGKDWGKNGFALWYYEDWLENISDGWVFRLAIPTPGIFGKTPRQARPSNTSGEELSSPKRISIAGHFVHFDDGKYSPRGDFWSSAEDLEKTAQRIKESASNYKHLLIYAHGGLNSPKSSANRVAALKEGFKRNGIYPFHIMYDTGLAEEIKDVLLRSRKSAEDHAEGFVDWITEKITDRTDILIEDIVRKPVTALWDEMKRDARRPFNASAKGDGLHVISSFAKTLGGTKMKIHLAGHSTGGVLIGHLLNALDNLQIPDLITSCSLMAPACTIDFYKQHYAHRLGTKSPGITHLTVLDIYNLNEKLEKDDNVAMVYRKSLLYLVSRALERESNKSILGMQKFQKEVKNLPGLNIIVSNGKSGPCRSTSHGGFDNDYRTMNAIMKRILQKPAPLPFTEDEMKGY